MSDDLDNVRDLIAMAEEHAETADDETRILIVQLGVKLIGAIDANQQHAAQLGKSLEAMSALIENMQGINAKLIQQIELDEQRIANLETQVFKLLGGTK